MCWACRRSRLHSCGGRLIWPAVTAMLAVALVLSSWFVFQQGADLVKVLIAGFNGGRYRRRGAPAIGTRFRPDERISRPRSQPHSRSHAGYADPDPAADARRARRPGLAGDGDAGAGGHSPGSGGHAAGGQRFDLQKYLTDAGFPELGAAH